jgi:hypothetical protein
MDRVSGSTMAILLAVGENPGRTATKHLAAQIYAKYCVNHDDPWTPEESIWLRKMRHDFGVMQKSHNALQKNHWTAALSPSQSPYSKWNFRNVTLCNERDRKETTLSGVDGIENDRALKAPQISGS